MKRRRKAFRSTGLLIRRSESSEAIASGSSLGSGCGGSLHAVSCMLFSKAIVAAAAKPQGDAPSAGRKIAVNGLAKASVVDRGTV